MCVGTLTSVWVCLRVSENVWWQCCVCGLYSVCLCVCVARLVDILHSVQTAYQHNDTWSCLRASGLGGTPLRGLPDSLTQTHTHTHTHAHMHTTTTRSFSSVLLNRDLT